MSIFVVFRITEPEKMKRAIESAYPNNYFELENNEWLISEKGTAKDVSDKLGITGSEHTVGSAIVFSMNSYFGRAPTNIWEWIKTKAEATDG